MRKYLHEIISKFPAEISNFHNQIQYPYCSACKTPPLFPVAKDRQSHISANGKDQISPICGELLINFNFYRTKLNKYR